MRTTTLLRSRIPALFLAGLLAPVCAPAIQREATTIPFPRRGAASVGLTAGPMLIRSVTLENRPSGRDLRSARRRDRRDTTLLRWVFRLANAGRRDWHGRIRVRVLGAADEVLASNDREGEVDAHDFRDRITVFTKIRTLDYRRAERVRIEADFFPD